jgi:GDP-L-fucose synthase
METAMKKILLTGGTGFMGQNILPLLRVSFRVTSPARTEMDLLDAVTVRKYLELGGYDAVIHLATPTAQNPVDKYEELFERSLRVFMSLAHCSELYGKMLYLGSGAEYGKHRDIAEIPEECFGEELPRDAYGLSRYVMSEIAQSKDNITNFRLFACHGPGDAPHKLIPYIIKCISEKRPIELRQNARFDYLYVDDVAQVMRFFINNTPKFKAYNLCSGQPIMLSDIAREVRRQMNVDVPIVFKSNGMGNEYTGSNARLAAGFPEWRPTSIEQAIERILDYENRQLRDRS